MASSLSLFERPAPTPAPEPEPTEAEKRAKWIVFYEAEAVRLEAFIAAHETYATTVAETHPHAAKAARELVERLHGHARDARRSAEELRAGAEVPRG